MYCTNCGTKCNEDAKFCTFCGSPLETAGASADANDAPAAEPAPTGDFAPAPATESVPAADHESAPAPQSESAPVPQPEPAPASTKPKRNPILFAAIAVAVVAVVAVALAVVFIVRPFSSASGTDDETNNISLGSGYATGADGWDYFFSYSAGGVYRAKTDGTVEAVLQVPKGDFGMLEYGVSNMSVDNGRLFFIKTSYTGTSVSSVCSVTLDGSDEEVLFEGTPFTNGTHCYPQELYLYDHTLYALVADYADGDTDWRLLTMDEDGSNQEELCTITDDVSDLVVTPERIFYTKNDYSSDSQTLGEIYAQDLDGTNFERVFKSNVGSLYSLAIAGDRLVFAQSNYDADKTIYTSINMDGTDEKTLYQVPSDLSGMLKAVTGGFLYLYLADTTDGDYAFDRAYRLARVSLEDGEAEELGDGAFYASTASVSNGHLVMSGIGGDISSLGYWVSAVGFDGEILATYQDPDADDGASGTDDDSVSDDDADADDEGNKSEGSSSSSDPVVESVTASSYLPTDSVNTSTYGPDNLIDGDLSLCWSEGASGSGAGESIVFAFDGEASVKGFRIANGFQISDDLYSANARPKRVEVFIDGTSIGSFGIADSGRAWQTIDFDETYEASSVKIEIEDVYEGSRHDDCCISEIEFF